MVGLVGSEQVLKKDHIIKQRIKWLLIDCQQWLILCWWTTWSDQFSSSCCLCWYTALVSALRGGLYQRSWSVTWFLSGVGTLWHDNCESRLWQPQQPHHRAHRDCTAGHPGDLTASDTHHLLSNDRLFFILCSFGLGKYFFKKKILFFFFTTENDVTYVTGLKSQILITG